MAAKQSKKKWIVRFVAQIFDVNGVSIIKLHPVYTNAFCCGIDKFKYTLFHLCIQQVNKLTYGKHAI